MRRKFNVFAVSAIAAMTFTACSNNDEASDKGVKYAPGTINLTQAQTVMNTNQNSFAWRLFSQVNKGAGGKSTVCSPLSMVYCLGMVNAGAAGTTSDEITKTLGFNAGADDINTYCNKLMDELPTIDKITTLNIANCVEVNTPYTLLSGYENSVKNSYNALVENRNFSDTGFKTYINSWASKQTDGMIPTLIDDVKTDAVAYIINAIYFKGLWTNKFDKSNTSKTAFTKADGNTSEVSMMHQKNDFKYYSNDVCQALSLDYGNGSYSMQILLPNDGKTTDDIITTMQSLNWKNFVNSMSSREVSAYIPKFTIEYGGEMNKTLNQLGIKTMFTTSADFSKFSNADVYVSKVVQKAKIEVDEQGTKAAAATYAEMELTSPGPGSSITFYADHPFIYVITEHSTGTICFIGEYCGE